MAPQHVPRIVAVALLGCLALFFMIASLNTAARSTFAQGSAKVSLFDRYERHQLTTENAQLKAQLQALTERMEQRNSALSRQNQRLLDALSGVVGQLPDARDLAAAAVARVPGAAAVAGAVPNAPESPLMSSFTLDDFIEPIASPRRPPLRTPDGNLDNFADFFCRKNDPA